VDAEFDQGVTVDTLLGGRVTLLQPARGFRASLDPLLLAGFLAPPFGRFLDIGCGTGALAFALLARDAGATGVAVELQAPLAALAEQGRARNGWAGRLTRARATCTVARELLEASFDPSQRTRCSGPWARGSSPRRALSNHEVALTLPSGPTSRRFRAPGRPRRRDLPADRALELPPCAPATSSPCAWLRPPARRPPGHSVLVEAQPGRTPLAVEPPLVVHAAGAERFTPEVRRMLGEA
jgi:hypothetical protein